MNEGKDRVMVMHVENFTKSLYWLPAMHFIEMISTFFGITGCSFETYIYNLFIRDGYFELYGQKHMAIFLYIWDISV